MSEKALEKLALIRGAEVYGKRSRTAVGLEPEAGKARSSTATVEGILQITRGRKHWQKNGRKHGHYFRAA